MDGVPLYRDCEPGWEADVFGGESKPIILSQNGLWLLLSGPGASTALTDSPMKVSLMQMFIVANWILIRQHYVP